MKKLILSVAVLLCIAPAANAQQQGTFWTGGSVSYKYTDVKDGVELNNFSIMPELGYSFNDNLGVGMRFGYAHKEFEAGGEKIKTDGFAVEPFARWTFLRGFNGGIFLDGGAGYSYTENKSTDIKTNVFEVGFKPGVRVNIANNVALTGRFGFVGYQYEKEGSQKTNSFGVDLDLSRLELGVNILF